MSCDLKTIMIVNCKCYQLLILSSCFFAITLPTLVQAENVPAIIEIKANDSTAPISINSADRLELDISVSSENNSNLPNDWWLYAQTPNGRYSYDASQRSWLKNNGIVSYQGKLVDLPDFNVFSDNGLPDGAYKIFFGIDNNMDGEEDKDWVFRTAKVNVSSVPVSNETIEQNAFVLQKMNEVYLWNGELPAIDHTQYASPEDLLSHLMHDQRDKWSSITDIESFQNFFEKGRYIGIGLVQHRRQEKGELSLKVGQVFAGSPVEQAGIVRGDRLLSINGKTIAEIESANLWESIFGADELGVQITLLVQDRQGTQREITLAKDWITKTSVEKFFTTENSKDATKKTGYLLFSAFINPSFQELQKAFSHFKQENISDLVLDLRYNGGGRGDVATYLASLIKGDYQEGQEFSRTLNNKQENEGLSYFSEETEALNLQRVAVITSDSSCSASELLINGLRPYIEVVLIGQQTCGKPVGTRPLDLPFDNKLLNAISFKVVNSLGEGDYFSGIDPTCFAEDNLNEGLGSPLEDSFREALYVIENGSCSSESVRSKKKSHPKKTNPITGFRSVVGAF